MKKYVKPELYYENFELSHSIANCTAALNHTETDCRLDPDEAPHLDLNEGESVFTSDNCTFTTDIMESYCYWSGTDLNNIFTS